MDVGHSISQSGAMSARGKPEFEFNAELARVVREALSAHGTDSFMIGEDGAAVDLYARPQTAAAAGATFLLSIHHDSVQPGYLERWQWQGVERRYSDRSSGYSLFVSRKNPQPQASLRCARLIGAALQEAGFRPAEHHAERIPGESREWADRAAGVYYFDDLVVLRTAPMPAVLLEAGVIVNRDEELRLQAPASRKAIADAIVRGLAGCQAAGPAPQ
ncbi:MAG: N-acetylmuramoyl-L-alanine amidase [Zoogloea sp.]|nr:N-acetylmuramoyl-L-alanine amidase [Zoogloea sp.]